MNAIDKQNASQHGNTTQKKDLRQKQGKIQTYLGQVQNKNQTVWINNRIREKSFSN